MGSLRFALALLLVAGCSPAPAPAPPCITIRDCATPLVCIRGECVAEPDVDAASEVDAASDVDAATEIDAASDVDAATEIDAGVDATSADAGRSPTATAILVPLYSSPGAVWSQLATSHDAHRSVETIAIINPNDGPEPTVDSDYTAGIDMLNDVWVDVVGYVQTDYGTRSAADVERDIDLYRAQYPQMIGIFFDQVELSGHESYYRDLVTHVHDAGYTTTIGNAGADIDLAFETVFDRVVVRSSAGAPSVSSFSRYVGRDRTRFGIICYAVPTLDTAYVTSLRTVIGAIYLTNDDLPDPWDTLPSYFDALLTALDD